MVSSIQLSMCISLLDNAIISPLLYNAIVFYIFFNFSILHNLYGVLLCILHNGVMQQGKVVYIIRGCIFGIEQEHLFDLFCPAHLRVQKFYPFS